ERVTTSTFAVADAVASGAAACSSGVFLLHAATARRKSPGRANRSMRHRTRGSSVRTSSSIDAPASPSHGHDPMQVLVTGATGFIGRALVHALRGRGAQ